MKSPTPTEPAIPLRGKPGYPYTYVRMPEPTHQYALSRQQSSEKCVIVLQSQIEPAKGDRLVLTKKKNIPKMQQLIFRSRTRATL